MGDNEKCEQCGGTGVVKGVAMGDHVCFCQYDHVDDAYLAETAIELVREMQEANKALRTFISEEFGAAFNERGRFFVSCPVCGVSFSYSIAALSQWPSGSLAYECPACSVAFSSEDKEAMLSKGFWEIQKGGEEDYA